MKRIYLFIGLIGAVTPFLEGAAETSAEQLAQSTPSCTSKTSWVPKVIDCAVSWLHDKKPPYVSVQTGAFWSWADAEQARSMAQEIADITGESVYNRRPVRIMARDAEGKIVRDENGNPVTTVSYEIERTPNGEIVVYKPDGLPLKPKILVWHVVHPQTK